MTGKTDADIEKEFAGLGYGAFKEAVGQSVVDVFGPAAFCMQLILSPAPGLSVGYAIYDAEVIGDNKLKILYEDNAGEVKTIYYDLL